MKLNEPAEIRPGAGSFPAFKRRIGEGSIGPVLNQTGKVRHRRHRSSEALGHERRLQLSAMGDAPRLAPA
jgi:hypothetical protein